VSVIYAIKFAVHVLLVTLAFVAAYTLRRGLGIDWWISDPLAALVVSWAIIYGAIAGAFELLLKNERGAWSYASITDIARLVRATGLTALTFLALIFISSRGITLPRSTLVLSWMLSLFFLVGVRLAWRMRVERSFRSVILGLRPRPAGTAKPLVLIGNPGAAAAYLKRHATEPTPAYDPIAILVGDARLVGQMILGVRVSGSYSDLETLLASPAFQPAERVALLFLDDPVAELNYEPDVIGRLRKTGRSMLRQPSLTELKAGGDALREIALEEFLPREPVVLDSAPIEALITGRRVLVTGAGGSIGSEICRQLVALGCSQITLIDHSEFLLFEVDRGLSGINPSIRKHAMICDVRDSARLDQIFTSERPEIVFHAAALKHVTLVEQNPCEAVLTNVLGTWNVSEASRRAGVSQFVLISTDKAVDPSSFMGATKRLAETVLPASSAALRYCVVRFGNVLGSAGSVVPIFRKQIEQGGPITVTHREVERYFMTIPEAVQLVLHAAAISASAKVPKTRKFLLEMGKPVKIYDMARQMIELCGLRPGVDIEIEITGLKPGEKLTEELMDTNEVATAVGLGLAELDTRGPTQALDRKAVERLAGLAREAGAEKTRSAVMAHVASIRAMA
jgi:O-antigen biosynthesis protein WbqV